MRSPRFSSVHEVTRSCLPIRAAVLQRRSSSRWTGSLSRRRSGPSHSGTTRSRNSKGETFATDALLLGRVTYEGFAAAWPGRKDPDGFADRFNSMPKYVVSSTLKKLNWNNSHLIRGDVVREVAKLKRQPGRDIVIHGSPGLIRSLLPHDLIDEFRLLVYPLVLGKGKRLFDESSAANLKLAESAAFDTGVVKLVYRPANMPRDVVRVPPNPDPRPRRHERK